MHLFVCAASVWHGDHSRTSYCLRDDWHVWFAVGDRSRCLSAYHHPAVCCRADCPAAWRAAAERLRSRLGHLAVHCNQYLWDDCVEGIQSDDCQHWPWYVVSQYVICDDQNWSHLFPDARTGLSDMRSLHLAVVCNCALLLWIPCRWSLTQIKFFTYRQCHSVGN